MHRKIRRWFRRDRCTCGLPWPCMELRLREIRQRPADPAPAWADTTQAMPQIGRPGALTPAQVYRANRGR